MACWHACTDHVQLRTLSAIMPCSPTSFVNTDNGLSASGSGCLDSRAPADRWHCRYIHLSKRCGNADRCMTSCTHQRLQPICTAALSLPQPLLARWGLDCCCYGGAHHGVPGPFALRRVAGAVLNVLQAKNSSVSRLRDKLLDQLASCCGGAYQAAFLTARSCAPFALLPDLLSSFGQLHPCYTQLLLALSSAIYGCTHERLFMQNRSCPRCVLVRPTTHVHCGCGDCDAYVSAVCTCMKARPCL